MGSGYLIEINETDELTHYGLFANFCFIQTFNERNSSFNTKCLSGCESKFPDTTYAKIFKTIFCNFNILFKAEVCQQSVIKCTNLSIKRIWAVQFGNLSDRKVEQLNSKRIFCTFKMHIAAILLLYRDV